MTEPVPINVGDRVRVHLVPGFWRTAGQFGGTVVRIDHYSAHRSFFWVELDIEVESQQGGRTRLISVLNPKHIQRIHDGFDS